ncbi:MAG: hypothetical protein JST80_10385 [Bdellovibrionales bacterium]|nr:hypothetical protein [Bdellovibrionales bacterium]
MKVILHRRKKRRLGNQGQALVEYIILLTIVMGVVAYFLSKMTGSFDMTTAKYGGVIEKQIRTGSAPATVWNR